MTRPGIPWHWAQDRLWVGGKVLGLLRLPDPWVPPFLIFTPLFTEAVRRSGSVRSAYAALSTAEARVLDGFLAEASARPFPQLLMRSNGVSEGREETRGQFDSMPVSSSRRALESALPRLCELSGQIPVLQYAIHPGLLGHLSNERRVSQRVRQWLVEFDDNGEQQFLRARVKDHSYGPGPLLAGSRRSVVLRLREVAAFVLADGPTRNHVEWVWDGARVWIVQCDECAATVSAEPIKAFLHNMTARPMPAPVDVEAFHEFDDLDDNWRKLRRPKEFRRLGLPHAAVYVLTGDEYVPADQRGLVERDLARLVNRTVILRTDLRTNAQGTDLLLPTSDPLDDVASAQRWMRRTSEEFAARGISDSEWAFLASNWVPAAASAWVHAYPKSAEVRIDATWGLPDGLNYLSYDSYFVSPSSGRILSRPHYKDLAYEYAIGKRRTIPVGPPYDWQPILNEEEARTLARWAETIADAEGRSIQLMAFVRIAGRRGASGCLPWHYTTLDLLPPDRASRILLPGTRLQEIRVPADLDKVGTDSSVRGFVLRPIGELPRDREFLVRLARSAVAKGLPVYLEGSLLGHAYYILRREGAEVVPVRPPDPAPMVVRYGKLVRDRIPAIVARSGGLARVSTIPREEARLFLTQKLIEEAFELWSARSQPKEALLEELGDVYEVLRSLAREIGFDMNAIERIATTRRESRGGFDRLLYLAETSSRGPERLDSTEEPAADEPIPMLNVHAGVPIIAAATDGSRLQIAVSMIPRPYPGKVRLPWGTSGPMLLTAHSEDGTMHLSLEPDRPMHPGQLQLPLGASEDLDAE